MKIEGNLIVREIAGEYILIPVGETALKLHGMITLTESGLLLWNKLKEECSREDLVNAILAEYDIDAETAGKDVDAFLEKLEAIDVLKKD